MTLIEKIVSNYINNLKNICTGIKTPSLKAPSPYPNMVVCNPFLKKNGPNKATLFCSLWKTITF